MPCEDIINAQVEENKQNHIKWGWKYEHSVAGFDNVQSFYFTSVNDFWPKLKAYLPDRGYENGKRIPKDAHFIKHWRDLERLKIEGYKLEKCYTQALLDANGDIDAIINGSSTNNSASNQSSSSRPSRQTNNKPNQKATNNQSNQSNTADISKMSLEETVDYADNADKRDDYINAIPALERLSKSQHQTSATAMRRLGEYYKYGWGVPKDLVKAQALFEKASIMGEGKTADANICENYMNGTGGVVENHPVAIKYCTVAANNGQPNAMAMLGWLYSAGTGTQNQKLANDWTCKAAQKGEPSAISNAKKLNLNCN